MVSYATINDKPIEKTAYDLLPDSARHRIEANGAEVQEKVGAALRQFRILDKVVADALRQLERDVVEFVTSHLFEELKEKNRAQLEILRFLEAVQGDVPEHIPDFRPQGPPVDGAPDISLMQRNERLARYEINVFIDNGGFGSAGCHRTQSQFRQLTRAHRLSRDVWRDGDRFPPDQGGFATSGQRRVSDSSGARSPAKPFRLGDAQTRTPVR